MNIIKLEQPLTDNTGLVQASLLQLLRDFSSQVSRRSSFLTLSGTALGSS